MEHCLLRLLMQSVTASLIKADWWICPRILLVIHEGVCLTHGTGGKATFEINGRCKMDHDIKPCKTVDRLTIRVVFMQDGLSPFRISLSFPSKQVAEH